MQEPIEYSTIRTHTRTNRIQYHKNTQYSTIRTRTRTNRTIVERENIPAAIQQTTNFREYTSSHTTDANFREETSTHTTDR